MRSNRLVGHTLPNEGRISDGAYWLARGPAVCSCGATSDVLPSDNARKAWHALHKDEVRNQAAALGDRVPDA